MRDTQQMTTSPNPTPAGWYPDPSGAPVQRYFDGSDWTQHWAPLVSDAEREEQLNVAVANDVALGARVLSRSRFQAVLLYSGGLSGAAHVVFALLSTFHLRTVPDRVDYRGGNVERATRDPHG